MSTEEKTETIYAPVVDTPGNYVREPADAHPPLNYPPYKSTVLRHPGHPLIYLPPDDHGGHRPRPSAKPGRPPQATPTSTRQHDGRAHRRADHRVRATCSTQLGQAPAQHS